MSQELVDALREENLCTYFILPLLKLNKFSFIVSNFVDSYLTPDGEKILVQVVDPALLSRTVFLGQTYTSTHVHKNKTYICFTIPRKYIRDVERFREGRFSEMSTAAKDDIRRYSRLAWEKREGGKVVTDGRLLALDRHGLLKDMWERMLNTDHKHPVILSEDDELLSIPGKESYIDLDELK